MSPSARSRFMGERSSWLRAAAIGVLIIAASCSAETEPTETTSTAVPATSTTTTALVTTTTSESAPDGPVVTTLVPELDAATGGIALDNQGNLFVASIGLVPRRRGTRVFRVTPDGAVSLFADDERLLGASGSAVDAEGNLYQAALRAGAILRITPDGTVEPFADDGVRSPVGVVVNEEDGGLFVADCGAGAVLRISAEGEVDVVAHDPQLNCPNGITIDEVGNLYVANFGDGRVLRVTQEGAVTELAVIPGGSNGHLAYHDGTLYVVGRNAHQIFTVTLDGTVVVFAGTGERGAGDGPATQATFSLPNGIAIDADGIIFINQVAGSSGSVNSPVAVRVIHPGT